MYPNDGTHVVMSILSVAAIGGVAWYAIFQVLPILQKILAGLIELPKLIGHLMDFVKLVIVVQAGVMALNVLYLGSDITKYISFLKDGASMAQSALGSMQWVMGLALWLFIGVVFVKSLTGKEVKDHGEHHMEHHQPQA